jgi:hypothetical protein
MSPDARAAAVLPVVAALVCAVADEDEAEIARILTEVTDWPALAVVLAGNVDDSRPLTLEVESFREEDRIGRIVAKTAAVTRIDADLILSRAQDRPTAAARAVAMYAAHLAGISYSATGRAFKRDHTTAIAAVSRVSADAVLRDLATRIASDCGITRPADEPDRSTDRRTHHCGCGARTKNPDGICGRCKEAHAA